MLGPKLKDEAMDRAHMVSFIIEEHLTSHPFIVANPGLADICYRIVRDLDDLYRAIGEIDVSDDAHSGRPDTP